MDNNNPNNNDDLDIKKELDNNLDVDNLQEETDDYTQMSFDTTPEPEPEPEIEIVEEDILYKDEAEFNENEECLDKPQIEIEDEDFEEYERHRFMLESDLMKALEDAKTISKEAEKNTSKAVKKAVLISTLISSLVTASAIGGYYVVSQNFSAPLSEIVINGNTTDNNVYKAVAMKATPSVVGITTLSIDTNNFFSLPMQTEGVGSGVIIDKKGYILTNSHVVDDGNATKVSVLFNDGKSVDGQILWNDANLDLAIIKVNKKNLTMAELGDSDTVEVGDLAIAIGNPIGLELNRSVTQGIISGKDRSLATKKGSMTGLLQTDASINPGNSGGPLLNEKGQVIGINTAKLNDSEGLGFAIPINTVKPILKQIIEKGDFEKVSLGIKGVDVSNVKAYLGVDLTAENGVYIIEVGTNTPASDSGIKTGDVIVSVDDQEITSMTDLNKALYQYRKGDKAKVKVIREGKETSLTVSFIKQKPKAELPESNKDTTDNVDNIQ